MKKNYPVLALMYCFIGILTTGSVSGAAYAPGTFSLKPLNVDLTYHSFGHEAADSRFQGYGISQAPGFPSVPFNNKINVYRGKPILGFSESDRHGAGYGLELGYMLGLNCELFGRLGFNRERGNGQFIAGDQDYTFSPRNNYGASLGLRHYFDFDSMFKPFIAGAAGFVKQGKAEAKVHAHNPFVHYLSDDNVYLGKYTMLKSQYLFTFELSAGVDWIFHPNWAMTVSMALRYDQRGGSQVTHFPAALTTNPFPFPLPARDVTYADNKQHWYIPFVVSLKCIL